MFAAIIVSLLFSKANSNKIYFGNLAASALGVIFPIFAVNPYKSEDVLIMLMFLPAVFILILAFGFRHILTKAVTAIAAIVLIYGTSAILMHNLKLPEELAKSEYEEQIIPNIKNTYDRQFMQKNYRKEGDKYLYNGDKYGIKRAKYILHDIGHWKSLDLNYNINRSNTTADKEGRNWVDRLVDAVTTTSKVDLDKVDGRKTWYAHMPGNNWKLIYSQDDLMGKIDFFNINNKTIIYTTNGIPLDTALQSNGTIWDPRLPHVDNPNIFIIGLSYDGLVKSAKRQPGSRVSGVEFSPVLMELLTEDNRKGYFSKFANYPYKDVEAYEAEGRYFLTSNTETYDMITLMNMHPEYPAIATLMPEYLHTVEATKMMLNKLSDKGMLVYEEILETPRARYAFYKFLNTVRYTLENELGVKDPSRHVLIYSWDFWGPNQNFQTVLVKRSPFTQKELATFARYHNVIAPRYGSGITLHPTIKTGHTFERIFNAKEPVYEMTEYPNRVGKSKFEEEMLPLIKNREDAEFFKSLFTYSKQYNRYYLKRNAVNDSNKERVHSILDQIDFPYEVDLTPTTDNRPFPFNVYKNKKEVQVLLDVIVKLAGILFIPVILLTIIRYRSQGFKLPLHTVFFSLLGLGFMMVEIVLMQKYQRFIGSPVYSTIVILGGLLFFSGLGSYFSRNFSRKTLIICITAIPVLILFQALFADSIFTALAKYSFTTKLFISSAMIFPLAFLMGLPFPHALEQIKQDISDEYATLMFGINGALMTVATILTILVNVTYGLNTSFATGFAAYAAALGMFIIIRK
jgi:predicted membrane-bound spermidine synthase